MKKVIHNQGFALIYTLLFIVLLLIVVSATWFTGMADLRLSQRSVYSSQATLLAKAGIEDGWRTYKDAIGSTYTLPVKNFPATVGDPCATTGASVHRVYQSTSPAEDVSSGSTVPSLTEQTSGVYDYRVCSSGTQKYISAVGYYLGNKITLNAIIDHSGDAYKNSAGSACNPSAVPPDLNVCVSIDHSKDYITITQTGPSS